MPCKISCEWNMTSLMFDVIVPSSSSPPCFLLLSSIEWRQKCSKILNTKWINLNYCHFLLWRLQKEVAVNKNCCSELFSVRAQSIQATLCTCKMCTVTAGAYGTHLELHALLSNTTSPPAGVNLRAQVNAALQVSSFHVRLSKEYSWFSVTSDTIISEKLVNPVKL